MLKHIWLHFVNAYISLGLFFYYKKIKAYNKDCIPKDKPVIFLSNHQNALLDALLIATQSGRFSYFLTRAAVFKKPFVSKLLHSVQMLPVYRVRDGWNTITQNKSVFSSCTELLHKKNAVAIFPEGSHNLNRTVRPLSKGFTRIVFETLEKYPDTDLQLVPVGLNFVKAEDFPDSMAVFFGKPISAKKYVLADKNKGVNKLKQDVFQSISKLTTHVDPDNYDESIRKLDTLQVDFLNPKAVNNCMASNFKDCESKRAPRTKSIKAVFKFMMILSLIGPYSVWKYVAKPKIDEIEFQSTFRFALGITLVPIWLVLIVVILGLSFCWLIALSFLMLTFVFSLLAVKL